MKLCANVNSQNFSLLRIVILNLCTVFIFNCISSWRLPIWHYEHRQHHWMAIFDSFLQVAGVFGAKRRHKQPYASASSGWISCEVWVRTCQLRLLSFRGIQTFFKDFGDLCFPDLSTLNSIPHLSTGDFILDGMKFRIVFPGKRLAKPSMKSPKPSLSAWSSSINNRNLIED